MFLSVQLFFLPSVLSCPLFLLSVSLFLSLIITSFVSLCCVSFACLCLFLSFTSSAVSPSWSSFEYHDLFLLLWTYTSKLPDAIAAYPIRFAQVRRKKQARAKEKKEITRRRKAKNVHRYCKQLEDKVNRERKKRASREREREREITNSSEGQDERTQTCKLADALLAYSHWRSKRSRKTQQQQANPHGEGLHQRFVVRVVFFCEISSTH